MAKRIRPFTLLPVVIAAAVSCEPAPQTEGAAPTAEAATPSGATIDYDALAERLVTQNIGVKEGERVLITGGADDIELLEDLAVQARRVGAFPMITLISDRLARRLVTDVPERFDTQTDRLMVSMANAFDVAITVDPPAAPDLLADVPDERLARRAEAGNAVADAFDKGKVRLVNVGNAMNPSPANAARLGLAVDQLARVYWAGVGVDPATMQARGEALQTKLAAGRVLHITSPDGTDLTVHIAGRPAFVSDGMITAEEAMKGGAAKYLWLPAGEVYFTPVAGSAHGTVVADQWYEGRQIPDLRLTFAAGKLTGMTAPSGIEPLQSAYAAATSPRKDEFAFVDFGINPAVRGAEDAPILTWVADGMVSVGIGNNTWAGGDNNSPFGLALHIANATVTLDGTVLVRDGIIQ